MPLYVVDHRGGPATAEYERSQRILVETDTTNAADLPEALRSSADSISFGKIEALLTGRIPQGADGVVTWFSGDQILQGSAASIWKELRTLGRRCFVPVHVPCMTEADLLALEPRWMSGGRMRDFWSSAARVARVSALSPRAAATLNAVNQPWAKLLQAFFADRATPGAGIEALARLAQDANTPPQFRSLALRNLIVLLMRHGNMARAEQVLEGALEAFQSYAELCYVGGLLYVHQQKPQKALNLLNRARYCNHDLVGSGGETAYRSGWLIGKIAAQAGNQSPAFENFYYGMIAKPAFTPAVDELLNMRVPPALVEQRQFDFSRFVRNEPRYLDRVFDFLLLHRAFPAARRIANTMPLSEGEKVSLLQRLAEAESPFLPASSRSGKPGVLLSGSFFEYSSLARINREIALALMQSSHFDVALEPSCHPLLPAQAIPGAKALTEATLHHPQHLDLMIRHQWPPDFQRPKRGKLAVILPWEYGAIPRAWVEQIERNVDELWVPSHFVRNVCMRAGVAENRVRVIPNGIDPKTLTPEGPASRPTGCHGFMFLFVGGAIQRKGIEVLLSAYAEAFEPGDDVTLTISTGANPAYAHNTLDGLLAEFIANARLPHLAYIAEQFDDSKLANLYRGCDAFVLPYRGEGFGMPIAEAMACGKPIITTAAGPAPEFCTAECGYFVPAVETEVPDPPPPFGEFVGPWTWFEPNISALARTMRYVYEHREEAAERGRNAAKVIRRTHTWGRVAAMYLERVAHLTENDSASCLGMQQMDAEEECPKLLSR